MNLVEVFQICSFMQLLHICSAFHQPVFLTSLQSSSSSFSTSSKNVIQWGTKARALSTLRSNSIEITPFTEEESSIAKASEFMLNSFWIPLSSDEVSSSTSTSSSSSSQLLPSIKEEFTSRYGEIMGKRKLKSCLLSAQNNDDNLLVGIVGIDVTLIDVKNQIQFTRNEAEQTLTKAVSSLGPKQRREYKNSSVREIVDALLPNLQVAVVLSNLAVDPNQRKKGIGLQLCNFVEKVVKEEMDVDQIYLRVESDNVAARKLYEGKLGYETAWVEDDAVALRANLDSGEFYEVAKTTVSLCKKLY